MSDKYASLKSAADAALEITHSLIQAGLLGSPASHSTTQEFVDSLIKTKDGIEAALRARYPSQAGSITFSP